MKTINVDSSVHDDVLVDADAAARILGVRKATLYAYVSRGLLQSHGQARSKGNRYFVSDLRRLKARSAARAGHTAVAAGALRWGEPVLDTAISGITDRGPVYRGHLAVDLAEAGVSYERVAELLWTGVLPSDAPAWTGPTRRRSAVAMPMPPTSLDFFITLAAEVGRCALRDESRHLTEESREIARARTLLAHLAGLGAHSSSFAEAIAIALGLAPTNRTRRAVDMMLVLVADHELNASTFAARIAASTGADLYACVVSALAAASGPRHGAAAARVEAFLGEVGEPSRARTIVDARNQRGEGVPGFGHPLYPQGDPRAVPLLAHARRLAPRSRLVRTVDAVCAQMLRTRRERPNVDFALVAVAEALGAPRGTASLLFVLGRTAGWIAHVLEQRSAGFLLRPRARYVGP